MGGRNLRPAASCRALGCAGQQWQRAACRPRRARAGLRMTADDCHAMFGATFQDGARFGIGVVVLKMCVMASAGRKLASEPVRGGAITRHWSLTSATAGPPTGRPTPTPEPNPLQQPENPKPPMPMPTDGGGLYRTCGSLTIETPEAGVTTVALRDQRRTGRRLHAAYHNLHGTGPRIVVRLGCVRCRQSRAGTRNQQ